MDGGNRPVKKFYKNSTNVKNDLLCKIDLKEAYFSVSPNKNSQKFVRFQWSGNLYEFPCLRLGLGPATRIFTKLLKVTIARPLETGQHFNHDLPRRYVANGEAITRNSHGKRHIDFSNATFGFCDQPQKISPAPSKTNRISGLSNGYRENNFCFFRKELKHVSQ